MLSQEKKKSKGVDMEFIQDLKELFNSIYDDINHTSETLQNVEKSK